VLDFPCSKSRYRNTIGQWLTFGLHWAGELVVDISSFSGLGLGLSVRGFGDSACGYLRAGKPITRQGTAQGLRTV
jgi:hypothetical protein